MPFTGSFSAPQLLYLPMTQLALSVFSGPQIATGILWLVSPACAVGSVIVVFAP